MNHSFKDTNDTFIPIYKYNTKLNTDSVEWCPHEPYQNFFVCANYQLNPDTNARVGNILLFSVSSQTGLKLWQTLETFGVLDQKWCHYTINGSSVLGVVNSNHSLEIYKFYECQLQLITCYQLKEDVLILSLDWSTGKHNDKLEIICSDSKGFCHMFCLEDDILNYQASYPAHCYEAWISAYYYWNTNMFFSGGDDCLFLKFDKRCGAEPVFKNKTHEAGVTSIHSNVAKEFMLVTGSYDEKIRLWDLRAMKEPSAVVQMPGPVWRLKWDPRTFKYLLAACMLGGAHVLHDLKLVSSYYEHQSMVYGADWSYMDESSSLENCKENKVIATCSFYDNFLCVSRLNL
ncbi:hypothetical protein FQR65_LT13583 [Abscondita terminalis]|nr:hypothetical protein FQR65_LT13583 [Abscondita terminalis]